VQIAVPLTLPNNIIRTHSQVRAIHLYHLKIRSLVLGGSPLQDSTSFQSYAFNHAVNDRIQ
jgi:hypothetical protein